MAEVFGVKSEERISAYAKRLVDFSPKFVGQVCKAVINTEERFPSVATLIMQLHAIAGTKDNDREKGNNTFWQKFNAEERRLDEINAQFDKIIGKEKRNDYIKAWFKGVYGEEVFSALGNMGMSVGAFEKPAMFDLAESSMDPKRAVELGVRKQSKLSA